MGTKKERDFRKWQRSADNPRGMSASMLDFNRWKRENKERAQSTGVDQQLMQQEIEKLKKGQEAAEKAKQFGGGGQDFASRIIGEGLGRMGTDPEVQEALSMKKKIATEGISAQEQEAFRSKMAQQMSKAEQLAGLRMGSALGGAQGASVAAQQRSLMEMGLRGRADIERDIFLKAEEAKRGGIESFSEALGEVKSFDIGQTAAEKQIRLQAGLGMEQMKSAERAAEASAKASGGGGKK